MPGVRIHRLYPRNDFVMDVVAKKPLFDTYGQMQMCYQGWMG